MLASSRVRILQDHVDILARHQQVKDAIDTVKDRAEASRICGHALLRLMQHLADEEAIMLGIGYPEDEQRRHVDHHRMIADYLRHELRRFQDGASDGRQAVEMADEWLESHKQLFDNHLLAYMQGRLR